MIAGHLHVIRRSIFALMVTFAGLLVFLPGIGWGLPSREVDAALFGDRTPWTGKQILELLKDAGEPMNAEGGRPSDEKVGPNALSLTSSSISPPSPVSRGADVDVNPILDRSQPVVLNDTDARRAEIVQRYRLMSKQPDEFIQFKALAEMSQRQGISRLDPRLYQYGGLWIYPVGALLRSAMLVGWIEQPPPGVAAKEFYLDHPDVFGKFYVVARAYSTFWGIVAALAVAWIVRRLTNSNTLAFLAAAAFILLPVTRTAAHEAKPHLAGAALCLCAFLAACRFVDSGRKRWALLAGALCGAAMAMVVSMLLSLAVLPMMAWLRWRSAKADLRAPDFKAVSERVGAAARPHSNSPARGDVSFEEARTDQQSLSIPLHDPSSPRRAVIVRFALACVGAVLVYVATNPFLIYNALFHREILQSNLGNSTAMYGVGDIGAALASALRIAVKGMTLGGVILAGLSLIVLVLSSFLRQSDAHTAPDRIASDGARHRIPDRGIRITAVGWLLAAPAVCVLIQFILLAAGKPAEYARFGLVLFAAAVVMTTLVVHRLSARKEAWVATVAIVVCLVADSILLQNNQQAATSARLLAARQTLSHLEPGRDVLRIGLSHEPAPWSVMPLNLFRDQLILTKPAADPASAVYDVYLYPSNLSSQIGLGGEPESVDWAKNRTQLIPGALPTTRPAFVP